MQKLIYTRKRNKHFLLPVTHYYVVPRDPALYFVSYCKDKLPEGLEPFMHITQNEWLGQKCKKPKEEDFVICECKYDAANLESGCGEGCLNVLTNTECTPGHCPCSEHCRNQKFQNCEYSKTKLFKTEGRGWGLLADENIKAGQFIIEYTGEVITADEAAERSHTYEAQGLKDAYIISLNANYYIDATKKGSLGRFINHSCQPNCETRKWTVLGETRVGIFAKQDISVGTELAYDYNFEWYGGAAVRCLCGAEKCSVFLGAKSHGFQEYNHLWEEGDDRYTVENVPLYDSAEDDHFPVVANYSNVVESKIKLEGVDGVESQKSANIHEMGEEQVKMEVDKETEVDLEQTKQSFARTNPMISRIRSSSAARNYNINAGPASSKRTQTTPTKQKAKGTGKKNVSFKPSAQLFTSKEAREEVTKYEELKNKATSELKTVYDEIRPAIEEHDRDNQHNVPTHVAEKWMEATCAKFKADFMFNFSFVKNVMCPKTASTDEKPSEGVADQKEN